MLNCICQAYKFTITSCQGPAVSISLLKFAKLCSLRSIAYTFEMYLGTKPLLKGFSVYNKLQQ